MVKLRLWDVTCKWPFCLLRYHVRCVLYYLLLRIDHLDNWDLEFIKQYNYVYQQMIIYKKYIYWKLNCLVDLKFKLQLFSSAFFIFLETNKLFFLASPTVLLLQWSQICPVWLLISEGKWQYASKIDRNSCHFKLGNFYWFIKYSS